MTRNELKQNAIQKLESAKALLDANCYNDCIYLAGYSVELALKWKFCKKLKIDFPENLADVNIKTHNLKSLLHLCGEKLKLEKNPHWSLLINEFKWSEKIRYNTDIITRENATLMLKSCSGLLKKLKLIT